MADDNSETTSYRDAGVDLEAAEDAVKRYRDIVASTHVDGVIGGLGGFGGLFSLRDAAVDMDDPVLVSGTDGVGTKLMIAFARDRHDTIGIDCVAMCVNDVITSGARPLFFLDYLATGKLEPAQAEAVVSGIARGCRESGCALIGGETAEMPGFYGAGEYDVAGFCVGIVDRGAMWTPHRVSDGDAIVGIASSGLHSNGFSLVRKVVDDARLDLDSDYPEFGEVPLGDVLLQPTRLYPAAFEALAGAVDVHTAAHITGGGFYENLPRALPAGAGVRIDPQTWERPTVFDFVAGEGNVPTAELYRVFNMGIGMAVVLAPGSVDAAIAALDGAGYRAWDIGRVVAGKGVVLEGID